MTAMHSFEELENHLIKITGVVNYFEKVQLNQKNGAIVIEKLTEDLENLKKYNDTFSKQLILSTSYSKEENRVHTLYVNLKEKYNQLERLYFNIEKKNLFIEQNHMSNILQLEECFEHEKEKMELKHFEETQRITAKIQAEKLERCNLEKQHQNELLILQAARAVQSDDTESYRQLELREANCKIEELNCISNSMRDELFELRRINAENKQVKEQLEQKLVLLTEEVLKCKNRCPEFQTNYSVDDFASTSLQECLYSKNNCTIVESDNKNVISTRKRPNLNSLLNSPFKKRRLFNSNHLGYLKDLEQSR